MFATDPYRDLNKLTESISNIDQAQKMSTGMASEVDVPAPNFFGNAAHEYYAH